MMLAWSLQHSGLVVDEPEQTSGKPGVNMDRKILIKAAAIGSVGLVLLLAGLFARRQQRVAVVRRIPIKEHFRYWNITSAPGDSGLDR